MKEKPKWALQDLIIPVLAFLFAIYYISTIWDIPQMAKWYGGGLSVINIALFATSFILIAKSGAFKNLKNPITYIKENWKTQVIVTYRHSIILFGIVGLYIALLPVFGYALCSLAFVSGTMFYLRERKVKTIVFGALTVTLIGFTLFVIVLNVPMPLDMASEEIRQYFYVLLH